MTTKDGHTIDDLIGKRVRYLNLPGGYPDYRGTVVGRWPAFAGSGVQDNWADIKWDVPYHPCTNPMEIVHLELVEEKP